MRIAKSDAGFRNWLTRRLDVGPAMEMRLAMRTVMPEAWKVSTLLTYALRHRVLPPYTVVERTDEGEWHLVPDIAALEGGTHQSDVHKTWDPRIDPDHDHVHYPSTVRPYWWHTGEVFDWLYTRPTVEARWTRLWRLPHESTSTPRPLPSPLDLPVANAEHHSGDETPSALRGTSTKAPVSITGRSRANGAGRRIGSPRKPASKSTRRTKRRSE